MEKIKRKSLLYKTKVEYGDYTINHVQGCSHGCLYPCYAYLIANRFRKIDSYNNWVKPKIVENTISLLEKEIPRLRNKISSVHLCFTTDPFMMGYPEVSDLSIEIIKLLNKHNIKCTALTKGLLPKELIQLSKENEFGITLISLDENFRKEIEPFAANYKDRIERLFFLHEKGFKTWVSIEPYPTPNIIDQDFLEILEAISFVDKIIFGRLHYNKRVSQYKDYQNFFNQLAYQVIDFCKAKNIEYHIKEKTLV